MGSITIKQFLDSVELNFDPRFVTKNKNGNIDIWDTCPIKGATTWKGQSEQHKHIMVSPVFRISEFEDRHWSKCIYEIPKKIDYNKYIGKLCKFWDEKETPIYDILTKAYPEHVAMRFYTPNGLGYYFCEPILSDSKLIAPADVEN